MNRFDLVRSKMADKLGELSWSWTSVRDSVSMIICYVTFVLFHFSYYVCEAFLIYTWALLFVFSPLLIALFVLPVTSGATKALYRSLIEVGCWKVVWGVLSTLLWSAALSDLNKPEEGISFITVICYNLILAGSLLMTPFVVHAMAKSGLASLTRTVGSIGLGAAAFAPGTLLRLGTEYTKRSYNAVHTGADSITTRYFPKGQKFIQALPRFQLPKRPPTFEKPKKEGK